MATRYDFYQSDAALVISIYKKGVPADQVRVVAHAEEVEVFVHDESILRLEPLAGTIVGEDVTHKVYGTKIELIVPKVTGGHWPSLIRSKGASPAQSAVHRPVQQTPKEPTTAAPAPKRKNWDSLAKEIDTDEQEPESNPDAFFKSLYGDLDEDSRRAMLKSYQESNGTVLSTNWGEVGSKFQAPQPPAGMEVKKA
ncbi:hypothetical protein NliqN6_6753 [Naganishia liquefaciens]|uniref:SGS domain-containing protein n=1 Tax=Naganishia liquefaciens TaxID=104408 RepID=A0A8H3U0I8_9TREE|nr:hypothetical protein NliqN6_6753 [Naganishia liquefaciens]